MGIRAIVNKGVSYELLSSFNTFSKKVTGELLVFASKPILSPLSLKDLSKDGLLGFTDAEGCFYIRLRTNRNKNGYWAGLAFTITQHSRDILLFKLIKEFLAVGNVVFVFFDVISFRNY
jgi:hypothetical protein